ncbi:alpha/beta fold hydrolase [Vibrio sp. PP-XX7]
MGKSTYPDKQFPTHLERQSELLGPTLKHIWQHNGHQKIILVGHSLGGSLVPLLAADYPEYTRGVVILAGDVNPKLAQARWYNTLLNWIPDALIPDEWAHSNMEVLALSESLSQVQQRLAQLHTPITILQGTADELVDPDNAKIAKQLFQHSQLKVEWIPGAGHIIHLQHIDLVKAAIEKMNQRS